MIFEEFGVSWNKFFNISKAKKRSKVKLDRKKAIIIIIRDLIIAVKVE
jgi:hypothetical protein